MSSILMLPQIPTTSCRYPVPPTKEQQGRTDLAIAPWLKQQRREDVVLATKVIASTALPLGRTTRTRSGHHHHIAVPGNVSCSYFQHSQCLQITCKLHQHISKPHLEANRNASSRAFSLMLVLQHGSCFEHPTMLGGAIHTVALALRS